MTLKIPYLYFNEDAFVLDPAKVQNRAQYNLLRALYTPLFLIDNNGQIQPGLADTYRWSKNKLIIKLKETLTSKGEKISAEDVVFSFNRLMILNSNTHGNLRTYFCSEQDNITLKEPCKDITIEENEIVFNLVNENKKHFFIPQLASMDFVIIPKSSIDLVDKELKIKDYSNTTGAYFIKSIANGEMTLIKNSNSQFSSNLNADKIQLFNTPTEKIIESFNDKKINAITTVTELSSEDIQLLKDNNEDIYVHKTEPIRQLLIVFMKRGLEELSIKQRVSLSDQVKEAIYASDLHNDILKSPEFFPPHGAKGSLTKKQKTELKEFLKTDQGFRGDFEIEISDANLKKWEKTVNLPTHIKLRGMKKFPVSLPVDQQPHAIIVYGDSSFFEDVSLLSYGIAMGALTREKKEGFKWVSDYMNIESSEARSEKLKKFHLSILKNGITFPVGFLSYYAVSRKPWKLNFSKYYAGSPLWQIKK